VCHYQVHCSSIAFVGEKVFRTAWFSYIRLVRFENDMQCPHCGPSPKVTIWDGVTLAFAKKKLLPTIQPPTRTDELSKLKPLVKPLQGLQIFPERALRKLIQNILLGPSLQLPELLRASEGTENETETTRDDKLMLERIELIPQAVLKLSDESLELGLLFDRWLGLTYLSTGESPPREYRDLFLQVNITEISTVVPN